MSWIHHSGQVATSNSYLKLWKHSAHETATQLEHLKGIKGQLGAFEPTLILKKEKEIKCPIKDDQKLKFIVPKVEWI